MRSGGVGCQFLGVGHRASGGDGQMGDATDLGLCNVVLIQTSPAMDSQSQSTSQALWNGSPVD
ncbi:MAG: hypothetical protein NW224_06475 [Leptolyngbyaceae cyanobacterium bins.302]|nr:hypothetical protein [Leptolyngbyaceae cyanobacterium bins.302]